MKVEKFYGRCVDLETSQILLRNENGTRSFSLRTPPMGIVVGDIVEVTDEEARLLTPNRTARKNSQISHISKWMNSTLDPRRLRAIAIRNQVEDAIREFFRGRSFQEVHTPLLVPCPGMEPHIRPLGVTRIHSTSEMATFLPTSPEFAMKRLLVGGLERIFQICPAFRDEPNSATHSAEFSMLEWYRAYTTYEEIMKDTEELFAFIAQKISGEPFLTFQGRKISVATPWPRLRVRDLFLQKAQIDLTRSTTKEDLAAECQRLGLNADLAREDWDDLYFKIWLNKIEPTLPSDQAVFVTRYPASQAALAVIDSDPDGSRWARRFEVYAGGIELGNAFEELTDPSEQRQRFIKDMELRERVYGPEFPKNPLDQGFLEALSEGMPPAGGIAMGVDRIAMLFADEPDIFYTMWIPPGGLG